MNQRTKLASALLAFAFVFSLTAWSHGAQTSESAVSVNSFKQSPQRYFRLTFRVLEVSPEGKVVDSRSYNEIIASGVKSAQTSSIRTGDRVPVATGSYSSDTPAKNLVNTQFQYIDVGTNIDAQKAEVVDQTLCLHVTADLSSMSKSVLMGNLHEPVIRHTRWDSNVTVPIGKATLIFSSDNSSDKGKTELELTAVPINQ